MWYTVVCIELTVFAQGSLGVHHRFYTRNLIGHNKAYVMLRHKPLPGETFCLLRLEFRRDWHMVLCQAERTFD